MRFGILSLGLGLFLAPGHAAVTGMVTDNSGKPLSGVSVRFVDEANPAGEAVAFTNAAGAYTLQLPAPGTTEIQRTPWRKADFASADPRSGNGRFYSLSGRWVDFRQSRPGSGWYFLRPEREEALSSPSQPDPESHPLAKSAAARIFHAYLTGKGAYPFQAPAVALNDGDTRDFRLTAVNLWDSTRAILRDSLANCAYQFKTVKQGRVAFLGGSITFNPGWRDSVQNYLKKKYPGTVFDFINAGIPSVGSDMHGFRLRRDVLEKGKVDLLFFESAVNDTTNKVPSIVRTRAYEGILRQALKNNPFMDIVYLYFAEASFYPNVAAGKPIALISDYESSAVQYGIPSLNLAQYVAERYTWAEFGGDVHPGPLGQGIYFRGITKLLDAAWGGSGAIQAPVAHRVPVKMMDSLCYYQGHTDSISKAVLANGWKRIASWKPTDVGTRDGFVNVPVLEATTPGDTLKLTFTGTAIGIVVPAGPDVGMLDYAIDGKALGTRDQFTPWSSGLHIPWTYIFSSDLEMKQHELRLVIATGKNPASTGHACRIIRFVVNGPG